MRYVTFFYDIINKQVYDFKIHENKEKALKHFNSESHKWFKFNTKFEADRLPATYGPPLRKYYGVSARIFKKMFNISIDEAIAIIESEE